MLKRATLIFALTISTLIHANDSLWQSTETIWNFGIISQCDVGTYPNPYQYFEDEPSFIESLYKNIQSGDIVWVRSKFIVTFYYNVLPKIKSPFVLVISDGDEIFPSDCATILNVEGFINNPKIIHIFAQNCDYHGSSNKVTQLPIGIDFHTIAYKGGRWGEYGTPREQEHALNTILEGLQPTYMRKLGAFIDFQIIDTTHHIYKRYLRWGEDRASIFQQILPSGLIEYGDYMKRTDLWKTKGQYAFSISPHGNGLDCHRTWEDLMLGCIVIVKTSALDPLYSGLPVVIVKEWSEITRENMEKWLAQYGDAFTNPDYRMKLTNAYWWQKIHAAALPYKSQGNP